MNFSEIEKLAQTFVDSKIYGDCTKEQAIVKIYAGHEIGIGPVASMRDVVMINGKLTLLGAQISNQIKRSKCYDFTVLETSDNQAKLRFTRHGSALNPDITFTYKDAERMGLADSPMYQKQMATMLFWRALTKGARMHCPDVFGGPIYTPDELKTNGHEPLPEPENTTVELESPFDYILEGESKYKGQKISEVPMEILKKAALITDTKRVTNRDRIMMILAIDQTMMEQSR